MVLLSSLVGLAAGGLLILLGRHRRGSPLPFGPFIAAAGWLWFVAGDGALDIYLHWTGLR